MLFALCVLGVHALPKPATEHTQLKGRVGGNVPALTSPHACMILVHRESLDGTNQAALGSGSIISSRHVVTAAHLVQGVNLRYQVGFIAGTANRLVDASFRLIHEDYDNSDFSNDIALLFLQGTATFPMAIAITLSSETEPPAEATELVTSGFGFTEAGSTGPTTRPFESAQIVVETCEFDNFNLTETHFCAIDSSGANTFICPGDNGAGCHSAGATAVENRLFGVVSRVLAGCSEPQNTGFTFIGLYIDWISNITQIPVTTFITNYKKVHNLY